MYIVCVSVLIWRLISLYAADEDDYESVDVTLSISGEETQACINISTLCDKVFEFFDQSFIVILTSDDAAVNLGLNQLEIVIEDKNEGTSSVAISQV